ncbi:MAG TPA: Holliday junction resolvase RuvX [Thermoleophilia bacterium]|nr:Holliday junction resolvase RuvX [Thermoleophilia bacterium]
MRYLGVDLGDVRTGLALSDPHGVVCSPLEVVEERDRERLLLRIMEAARAHDVEKIVVGLPRPLRGGTNTQVDKVREFVVTLAERTATEVETWDERFTSQMAESGGASGPSRDAVAACYMLQNYLDSRAKRRGEE